VFSPVGVEIENNNNNLNNLSQVESTYFSHLLATIQPIISSRIAVKQHDKTRIVKQGLSNKEN
jgi:hypothetical protein